MITSMKLLKDIKQPQNCAKKTMKYKLACMRILTAEEFYKNDAVI